MFGGGVQDNGWELNIGKLVQVVVEFLIFSYAQITLGMVGNPKTYPLIATAFFIGCLSIKTFYNIKIFLRFK